MVTFIERKTYGLDDVLLEAHPYSSVKSRKDVDTSTKLKNGIVLQTPIISSCMQDVTDAKVAIAIFKVGAIGCIHRFVSIKEQADMVSAVTKVDAKCFAAVGISPDFPERTAALIAAGASGIIVDVAFLNQRTIGVCKYIKDKWPDIFLISGNVMSGAGFREGIEAGLDAIRVGIGGGNVCRTSRVCGVGIGYFTSILECLEEKEYAAAQGRQVLIICDGGMDVGGSFCKALAAGSSLAIMGRSFAGTWEAPGKSYIPFTRVYETGLERPNSPYEGMVEVLDEYIETYRKCKDPIYKEYRGSASMEAQVTYKPQEDIITSEGVASLVQVYGSVADVVGRYNGALRSSMSYVGAHNLDEYREKAVFRLVGEGVFSQTKARALQSREITI